VFLGTHTPRLDDKGRLALHEVMAVTEQIERLAVERASADAINTVAKSQGMKTLREDGLAPEVRTVLGSKPSDPSACRVLYVSPTGDVRRGDTITVTCQEFG